MSKKLISVLGVAIITLSLGTFSYLNAEGEKQDTSSAEIAELSKKIDKVLANQEEIMKLLRIVYSRT